MRYGQGAGAGLRFGFSLSQVVKILLAANVTIFVIQQFGGSLEGTLVERLGLVPSYVLGRLHVWQPFTYMFLHGSFHHILYNMLLLFFFGSELERLWGSRVFFQYYLTTGVGAGLVYALLMPLVVSGSENVPLIGASGAVYGLLIAMYRLFPDRKIMLYFLIPIPIRWFVIGLIAFDILSMWSMDGVGHLAHLGGAAVGWLYLGGGRKWFDGMMRSRRRKKSGFSTVKGGKTSGSRSDRSPGWTPQPGNRVDEILEKISREGLDSLTREEQEILRRASKH